MMSTSAITSALATSTTDNTTSSNISFRAFSKLNLTEAQRTQIRSIVKDALDDGTSSEDVQSQISAVLTPSQQALLEEQKASVGSSGGGESSGLSALSSSSVTGTANYQVSLYGPPPGPPPPGAPPGPSPLNSTSTTGANNSLFSVLNLTPAQANEITAILASVEAGSSTSSDSVKDQINGVLSASQQASLSAEFNSGLNQSSSITGAATSNVADQIAASSVLNVLQLQSELSA